MGLIGYLIFCLAVALIAFPIAYFLTKRLATEGGAIHASYVCFFVPFLIGFASLAFAQFAEPSSAELQARIASGELVDPGPASFVKWLITVGGPLAAYVAISVPLFIVARRRLSK